MNNILFEKVLIIGIGLIGSSIARALKDYTIATKIVGYDTNSEVIRKCIEINIIDEFIDSIEKCNDDFDFIIICTPLGTYKSIFESLNLQVKKPCVVTDVGSTKLSVIKIFENYCKNDNISFIPGHPIAGLEKSGPEYGFTELFH